MTQRQSQGRVQVETGAKTRQLLSRAKRATGQGGGRGGGRLWQGRAGGNDATWDLDSDGVSELFVNRKATVVAMQSSWHWAR